MFHDFQLSSHSNVDLTLPSQAPTRTGHKILKFVINGLRLQPAELQHAQNTLRYQEVKTKTSNFHHTVPELHTQFFDSGSHKPSPALDLGMKPSGAATRHGPQSTVARPAGSSHSSPSTQEALPGLLGQSGCSPAQEAFPACFHNPAARHELRSPTSPSLLGLNTAARP
ncbi:hypothetical protein Drorol1_Dr00010162 [Drosera rotundifolia]